MNNIDPGPKPELAWLPVAKLSVDPSYQRTLESRTSQDLVARIAEKFRWSAFQAVLAAKRGSGWVVIDGQHRVEAARRAGIEHVPAVVVAAGTIADEAAAFVQANLDRVVMHPVQLYHARLVAGDKAAASIASALKAAGITVPRSPRPAQANETLAIGSVWALVHHLDAGPAGEVLTAIAEPFRNVPGALRAPLIRAVHLVYVNEGKTQRERDQMLPLISVWLSKNRGLFDKAREMRLAGGGPEARIIADMLRRAANAFTPPPQATTSREPGGIKPPTSAQRMGRR